MPLKASRLAVQPFSDGCDVLLDATVVRNFAECGKATLDGLLSHLGERACVVAAVEGELTKKIGDLPLLEHALTSGLSERAITVSEDVKQDVADVLLANAGFLHPEEDRGETETVFHALEARDRGDSFAIVTDDGGAKSWARKQGLEVHDTPALVCHMVCSGVISEADGARVWRKATSQKNWNAYPDRLSQFRTEFYPDH